MGNTVDAGKRDGVCAVAGHGPRLRMRMRNHAVMNACSNVERGYGGGRAEQCQG